MSYTAPSSPNIDFTAVGPYYVAPVASAVDFTIYGERYLVGAAGDLTFSGEAAVAHGVAVTAVGDVAFSGSGNAGVTYVATGLGNLAFDGAAIVSNLSIDGTGWIVFSGESTLNFTPPEFEAIGSGSLLFSGVAYDLGWQISGAGRLSLSGSGALGSGVTLLGRNIGLLGGSAQVRRGVSAIGSGSLSPFNGNATLIRGIAADGNGSIFFSGQAVGIFVKGHTAIGVGALSFGGAGDVRFGEESVGPDGAIYARVSQWVMYALH